MLVANLTTDQGRLQALQLQAQAKAFDLAIDIIFDIANYEDPSKWQTSLKEMHQA
jgi:hypothetical protein